MNTIHSQVLQAPIKHLDRAYHNVFAKRAKFPRFKSRHKHMRFAYLQNVRVEGNYKNREVEGGIKSATITKKASGW